MIDPVIERQYSDCRELLALWKAFSEFYSMGVKGDHLTPEKENQFLQLKSRIAELHDSFMDALSHDQHIGQSMLDVISRSITLKHLNRLSTADVKKMEIEWHESYLLLNDTIGALEDKRNELALISETQYRTGKAAGAIRQKVTNFFTSAGFKLMLILGAVLFATVGIQAMGIFDWDTLGTQKWATVPYRWGKTVVRKVYNPDSEWVDVENAPRKPHVSWPAGLKVPSIDSTDVNTLLKQLPRDVPQDVRDILAQAKQYRLESTEKEFKGKLFLHSILLPQTSQAKKVIDWFESYAKSGDQGKSFTREWRMLRDHNVVTVINSSNSDLTNDAWVMIYEQTDRL